jgi:hypothetical protein
VYEGEEAVLEEGEERGGVGEARWSEPGGGGGAVGGGGGEGVGGGGI